MHRVSGVGRTESGADRCRRRLGARAALAGLVAEASWRRLAGLALLAAAYAAYAAGRWQAGRLVDLLWICNTSSLLLIGFYLSRYRLPLFLGAGGLLLGTALWAYVAFVRGDGRVEADVAALHLGGVGLGLGRVAGRPARWRWLFAALAFFLANLALFVALYDRPRAVLFLNRFYDPRRATLEKLGLFLLYLGIVAAYVVVLILLLKGAARLARGRTPRPVAAAAALAAALAAPAAAQPIGGRVETAEGTGLGGVEVRLFALADPRDAVALPAGEPPPLSITRTGADGRFLLSARGPGLYKVAVHRPGSLPAAAYPRLVGEAVELPPLELRAGEELRLALRLPGGEPARGARLAATPWSASWEAARRRGWWPEPRLAVADGRGEAAVVHDPDETLRVAATDGRLALARSLPPGPRPRALTLDLPLRPARLEAASGEPAAGVMAVLPWSLLALGASDEGGRLSLPAAPRPRSLQLFAAGGVLEIESPSPAPEGEEARVRLPARRRQAVRLVDAASGRPLAGAFAWAAGPLQPMAAADAEGRATVEVPAGGPAAIEAAAPGHLPARRRLGDGAVGEVVLALEAATSLTGRVVDPRGRPVGGAAIEAVPLDGAGREAASGPVAEAVSGASGRFTLGPLPAGRDHRLRARAPGHGPTAQRVPAALLRGGRAEVVVTLGAGLAITGSLIDAGERPIEGARVSAARRRPGSPPWAAGAEAHALSDAHGRFVLADLEAGLFDLAVAADGFAPRRLPTVEVPADASVSLEPLALERGVSVEGEVVDPEGRPVAGARVEVEPAEGPRRGAADLHRAVWTDRRGRFLLRDLPTDALALAVGHPRFASERLALFPGAAAAPLRIALSPAHALAGAVVTPDGAPAAGAWVVGETSGLCPRRTRADAAGRFRLESLAAGSLRVHAEAQGFQSETHEVRLPAAPESRLRLALVHPPALAGRVVGAGEAPLPGARVEIAGSGSRAPVARATAGGDGRFEVARLEPGAYRLTARRSGLAPAAVELEIVPGETAEAHLRLTEPVRLAVAGWVVDASGGNVAGAAVRLEGEEGAVVAAGASGAEGRFEVDAPAAGRYLLRAAADGFAEARSAVLAVEEPGVEGVVLTLPDGAAIEGAVLGLDPRDLPRLRVRADAEGRGSRRGVVLHDGRFRIPGLGEGRWSIVTELGGLSRPCGAVSVAAGETVLHDLRFEGAVRLRGLARRGGEPLAAARLDVACSDGSAGAVATDFEGRFELPAVHGRCSLRAAGAGAATAEVEAAAGGERTVELEAEEPPAASGREGLR